MDIREWEFQRGYIEVNLDYILHNMEQMKLHLNENTKILAVVKTDAYGHGSVSIARAIEHLDYLFGFAVATAEEAMELREAGITKPILVLSYSFPYAYPMLIEEDVRITVFRYDMLDTLSEIALKQDKEARVHIKVDTGMGRIGITPDYEGIKFVKEVLSKPGIKLEGIYTHFACADMSDLSSAKEQINKFEAFVKGAEIITGYQIPMHHCSNSAGIVQLPEANMDLVRAGITMYGLMPSDEVPADIIPLKPALSLCSHIAYLKEMLPGQTISYGSTYKVEKIMKVATIPLGYGDGYPRSLSDKGYVLIRGMRAKILGRICMDQFMVDVTDIPDVAEGDKVTLIGSDGEECITANALGELSGRFNYELVCDLNQRLPRVYVLNNELV